MRRPAVPSHCLLLLLLWTPAARAEDFPLSDIPVWVEPTPVDVARPLRAEDAVNGLHELLREEQVRVTHETTEHFVRRVRRVEGTRGVEEGSELRVSFAPSYQRLHLHGIWRTRGGRREQVLEPKDVKLLQQEEELERRIYREARTALVFVKDVRVGDVLEEAYTLEGTHPLFRGRYVGAVDLGSPVPLAHLVERLLVPADMPLHLQPQGTPAAAQVRTRAGEREYRWELEAVPALPEVPGIPSDVPFWPHVQVSSFATWAEVAQWDLALLEGLEGSAELDALVERLAALPDEEARFLAAVRFVQDEVRYLGMEIGPNTHQPHPPGQVLAQRFGDCKDKALLLVTLLRRLGIPADNALVDTRLRGSLAGRHPSPGVFNHVIVRATVAGRTEWVDATWTLQRGRPGSRTVPDYGLALVVAPGTTALEPIVAPPPASPLLDVDYRLQLDASGVGTLRVATRASGLEAERLRG